jgi:hypothetical protein
MSNKKRKPGKLLPGLYICGAEGQNRMRLRRNPGFYKLRCVRFDGYEAFGGNAVSVFLG